MPRGPSEGGNAPVRENVGGVRLGAPRACVRDLLASRPGRATVVTLVLAELMVALALVAGAAEDTREADLPVIVTVTAPKRLPVGVQGEIRLWYRARQANVVAVIRAIEDLDGPVMPRSTSEREFGVVARAFGREAGDLAVPVAFARPGLKRVTLTLVTDERVLSDPAVVEVEALP